MNKLKIIVIDREFCRYVKNESNHRIINALKKITEIEDLWILLDSKSIRSKNERILDFNFKMISDYKTNNVEDILKIENPDVILISNDYDMEIRSFIPVAKKMKIPIILMLHNTFFEGHLDKMTSALIQNRLTINKNRKKEIIEKIFFMLHNYKKSGYNIFQLANIGIKEVVNWFRYYQKSLMGNFGANLILVSGRSWHDELTKRELKSKIVITGNPIMDKFYEKIRYIQKIEKEENEIEIIFVTTSVVEHGGWTNNEWEQTVIQTIQELMKCSDKIKIKLKIHPTSEKKEKYERILKDMGVNIPIYQSENFIEVIQNADLIITFAHTTAIIEAIMLKKPIITINLFEYPKKNMPLVDQKISEEVKNIEKLNEVIFNQLKKKNSPEIDEFLEKIFYKIDGNSANRVAQAILQEINND